MRSRADSHYLAVLSKVVRKHHRQWASLCFSAGWLAISAPAAAQVDRAAQLPSEQDAPIALLVDMTSGQTLFARQADRRFAPASITKVMTTYTAFDQIRQGKLDLTQTLPVRPATFAKWQRVGSTMYLPANSRVSVNQLIVGINTVSANDGAAVLAEGVAGSVPAWLDLMNANAAKLGMENSRFATPNGWPDGGATYTTAYDLAKLAKATITDFPQLYRAYYGHPNFSFRGIRQRNHDPISGRVPGADGLKTGYTDAAGFGFLGSAERNGQRLILVIATSDSGAARDRAARSLLKWGFAQFQSHSVLPADHIIGEARINGGASRSVDLVLPEPLSVSLPRGQRPAVSLSVLPVEPVSAPVTAGTVVAQLEVRAAGVPSYTVPLHAAEDVPRANLLQRWRNALLDAIA